MTTVEFKPSEVRPWRGVLPFIGSKFGRAEREMAAYCIVRASRELGDQWQPLTWKQIGQTVIKQFEEGGDLHHLKANPFLPKPDPRDLVAKGFARFIGDPDADPPAPIEFTEKGYNALRETLPKTAP